MPWEDARYGCVFCRTGREKAVARALEQRYPGLEATALSQVKHRSEKGIKSTEEKILFPGYVFFRVADSESTPSGVAHVSDVLRVLVGMTGEWALRGEDERFAAWIFENGGVIGMSIAHKEGARVIVRSGPLKDFEGQVVKIDRRSRNGLVELRFDDRVWKIWLGFDVVGMEDDSIKA